MFKIKLAAMLLRSSGTEVEYIVRRIYARVSGRGTTVMVTRDLSEAIKKFDAMRIADTDIITITVSAVIDQRYGTISKTIYGENENAGC